MKSFFLLTLCLLITACASSYKKIGIGGGYDETILAPNQYRISFRGNGYTSMERAKDYAMLRCSEVTIQNGYRYFIITNDDSYKKQYSIYIPGETYTEYSSTSHGKLQRNGDFRLDTKGQATTVTTPGYSENIVKPKAVFIVLAFKDAQEAPRGAFDAYFLSQSLKSKYGIKDQ
ncbi:MAG: hypothetical protein VB106_14240 [Clostridiaceae bacterium]|nr:hypothetical protein [Clostridiaceae bacterium]